MTRRNTDRRAGERRTSPGERYRQFQEAQAYENSGALRIALRLYSKIGALNSVARVRAELGYWLAAPPVPRAA